MKLLQILLILPNLNFGQTVTEFPSTITTDFNEYPETILTAETFTDQTTSTENYPTASTVFSPTVSTRATFEHFISGGYEAVPNQFPWVVRLMIAKGPVQEGVCGGSIISNRFILTAGHCCDDYKNRPERISFRIGAHVDPSCGEVKRCTIESKFRRSTMYPNVNKMIGQEIEAEKVILHPNYKLNYGGSAAWDFCLIKSKTKIPLNEKTFAAIDLPDANLDVINKPCKIAGWGFTEKNVESKYLMKTISTQRSSDLARSYCKKARTKNKAFCSRGNFLRKADTTKGTCQGDSGGPYFCTVDGKPTLVGLTSYGANGRCGRGKLLRERLGFYADVREALDWIKENIKMRPTFRTHRRNTQKPHTQKCLWAEIPGFDIKTEYELRNNRWAPRNQRISGRPSKMQDACQCAEACRKNQRCQAFTFQVASKNCFLKGALQRRHFRPRQKFVFGKKLE